MHFKLLKIFVLLASVSVIQGCTAVGVASSAAAVGGIAATREGGLRQSAVDARIALEINDLWFKYDIEAFRKLNMTVEQGRVLVTGIVQNPDHRVEAIKLAWQPKGVTQVINEVRVDKSQGITGFARDTWITNNLRAKLIFDKDVQSINYTIDTVAATVYLMGIAQNQTELNKVIATARNTGYVKNVVSYVKMVGDQVMGLPQADTTYNPRLHSGQPQNTIPMSSPSSSTNYGNEYDGFQNQGMNSPTPPPRNTAVQATPLNDW